MKRSPAPNFSLPDQDGKMHSLKDYTGKWLVVYFYPKDGTPGCTKEACNFRDARDLIAELGKAKIVGVSKDSVHSHKNFSAKYNLNFTLLSDPGHKIIEAFGAWKLKRFMGREYMGIERNTYIIDPDGNIAKKYEKVTPETHTMELIKDLRDFQGQ